MFCENLPMFHVTNTLYFVPFCVLLQTEPYWDRLYVMGRPVSGNQSGHWIFFNITDTYVIDMRFRTDESVTNRGFRIKLAFYEPLNVVDLTLND